MKTIEGALMAVFGFVTAFLVCCLDTEILPAWYLPALVACGALTVLFGRLYWEVGDES